jgi:hypothetical protein
MRDSRELTAPRRLSKEISNSPAATTVATATGAATAIRLFQRSSCVKAKSRMAQPNHFSPQRHSARKFSQKYVQTMENYGGVTRYASRKPPGEAGNDR